MTPDLDATFAAVAALAREAGAGLHVAAEEPGTLVLSPTPGDAQGFAVAVMRKKGYVSLHVMPLYRRPELGEALPPALAKRRHGKSCFNFKALPTDEADGLRAFLRRALD